MAGAAAAVQGSRPGGGWTKETDVVVVGGGGSGSAAALSASEHGARVIVLESAPAMGGAGSLCIGSVTAPMTRLQKQAGISDSVVAYIDNILEMAGPQRVRMDMDLLRLLAENAGATVDWLQDHGVDLRGPFEYPDHKIKRMHMLYPRSAEWPKVVRPILERRGVEILTGSKGSELYRDESGRIIGIKAIDRQTGRPFKIQARKAVILTAGNLEGNPELKRRVTTPDIANLPAACPTNDGSGLIMAAALGAGMTMLDRVGGPGVRGMPPAPAVDSIVKQDWMPYGMVEAGSILVNKQGRRFTNEDVHGAAMCVALNKQPYQTGFLVFDRRVAEVFNKWPMVVGSFPGIAPVSKIGGWALVDDLIAREGIRKADTIEELAAAMGMDPGGLKATVESWNRYARDGKDPDFKRSTFGHKEANTLGAGIAAPPFFSHGPLRPIVPPADTSVVINTRLEVLDVFGRVMPGLYAGGNMGHGNLMLNGQGHQHGMSMSWAFTSGRLSGRNAATARA